MLTRSLVLLAGWLAGVALVGAAPQDPPTIEGPWNAEKARAVILDQLAAHASAGAFELGQGDSAPPPDHAIVAELTTPDGRGRILVTATRPADHFGCRPCAPSLGFVEWHVTEGGWRLCTASFAVTHDGSYGDPPAEIGLLAIGPRAVAVTTEHGDLAQGYSVSWRRLYAVVDDAWREIFFAEIAADDRGVSDDEPSVDWTAEMEVDTTSDGPFHDLVLRRSGLGVPEDGEDAGATTRYRFDGTSYRPAETASASPGDGLN